MRGKYNKHLVCPWCGKGETLVDGTAKLTISVQCSKCRKVYIGDLYTLKTERSTAQKRLGRRK